MKEKYVERNVVSSKNNKRKNVLNNDTFNGVTIISTHNEESADLSDHSPPLCTLI